MGIRVEERTRDAEPLDYQRLCDMAWHEIFDDAEGVVGSQVAWIGVSFGCLLYTSGLMHLASLQSENRMDFEDDSIEAHYNACLLYTSRCV